MTRYGIFIIVKGRFMCMELAINYVQVGNRSAVRIFLIEHKLLTRLKFWESCQGPILVQYQD